MKISDKQYSHRSLITPSPRDPALPSGSVNKALVKQRRSQQAARELELSKDTAMSELSQIGNSIAPLFMMYMDNSRKEREESHRREEERRREEKLEREERRRLDDMRFLAIMSSLRGNSQEDSGQPDPLALMLSQAATPKAASSPSDVAE